MVFSSENGDGLYSGRFSDKPTLREFSWRISVSESSQELHLSGREGLGNKIGQRKELDSYTVYQRAWLILWGLWS